MELLRLENVYKTYHVGEIDVPVLKGVSFSIRRGEMVAIMGSSGSGKSTLMNILGCLDRPTSGSYWLDGQDVGGLASDQRAAVRTAKLGFVFQSFNLLPRTTVLQNVLMPLDYASAPANARPSDHAYDLLDRVNLTDRIEHVPSQLSGGQQQRVAIARALVNRPVLLLADEPTGNLDSHTTVDILKMFQQLNAAGITVILVTHDPQVAAYAHRTIRVVDGLIEEDTAACRSGMTSANDDSRRSDAAHESFAGAAHAPLLARVGTSADSGGWTPASQSLGDTAVLTARAAEPKPIQSPALVEPSAASKATSPRASRAAFALVPSSLRTAVSALRRNKMRSALTTLGIVIGVSAVIAMVEIGQGSKVALEATVATMGANNLLVMSGAASSGGISFGMGSEKTLTPQDAAEIGRQCSAVDAVAPLVQIQAQVVHGNRNWVPMVVYGTTPPYLRVRDWAGMEAGSMFTDDDVLGSTKVCVIGVTLMRELFDGQSPVGQDIRVQNVSLRVVGVLSRKGANMMGMDQDDLVLAPWTTIKFRVSGNNSGGASRGSTVSSGTASSSATSKVNSLNNLYPDATSLFPQASETQAADTPQPVRFTNVDQILVKAASASLIPAALSQITGLLHERHHIRADQRDDFNLRDMSEIIKALGSMSKVMGGLLLIVGMISLAVGGVGIMNIMLVSVTERTREIGLRMAVGARGRHILKQFLIEATVFCLFGGLAGIVLGHGVALAVRLLLRWPIEASLPAIVAAFVVSAIVGIVFGFYPAWKASRLDPIEALRYE